MLSSGASGGNRADIALLVRSIGQRVACCFPLSIPDPLAVVHCA